MKKYTIILLAYLCSFFSYGQCPTTDIILVTQEEIDNFSITYPNCTNLTHNVKIQEHNELITNLDGLSLINSAQQIFIFGTHIENLYGLKNLIDINHLALWFNANLQNLEGLNSLEYINMLEMFINPNITDLSGMLVIEDIDNINLLNNQNLSDISQLGFIEVLNNIIISGNNLSNLSGLENIYKVNGDLNINHEQMENFSVFESLEFVEGSLIINFNENLKNLEAFQNIETLENLSIIQNVNLESLIGFDNLNTVNDRVRIGFNHSLNDLYGLVALENVNTIEIYENNQLVTLKGLENLIYVHERLLVNDNPKLYNVEHLVFVSSNHVDEVIMINNDLLSNCDFQLFCNIINDDAVYKVFNNNATGCNSIEEIAISCIDDFNENNEIIENRNFEELAIVSPNPVLNRASISLPKEHEFTYALVYSYSGQIVQESFVNNIDFSNITSGVYFIKIFTNQGIVIKKVIKQ